MKPVTIGAASGIALLLAFSAIAAAGPRDEIIASYAASAGEQLSAEGGKALFTGTHSGGKPDTPSCTTCHTTNLKGMGKTRAGKAIEPMAVSVNPKRFTDPAFVEKWFRRNCTTVLGRECSALEKGDLLTWLSSL